jgi:hypothetical protein
MSNFTFNASSGNTLTQSDVTNTLNGYTGNFTATLPASLTSIGDSGFRNISNLTSVSFESGSQLSTIGDYAFSSSGLSSITLPASLSTIGASAFQYTGLTSITIPDSVTSIGDSAFEGCTSLGSFTLPNNPLFTKIPDSCFRNSMNWTGTQVIPFNVTEIGDWAFCIYSNVSGEVRNLGNTTTYLKLPITFKDHIVNRPMYLTTTIDLIYAPDLNLVLDHFSHYKFSNNSSLVVQYESDGSDVVLTNYKVNGTSLRNFGKGIVKESDYCDYQNADVTTLNSAYALKPYAVAGGLTGYQMLGGDIIKRIAPFYTEYTTPGNQTITLFPNWTKLGFFVIGGGGGSGPGTTGWYYGKGGGGGGGRAFGYYTKSELGQGDLTQLNISVGAGGLFNGNIGGHDGGESKVSFNFHPYTDILLAEGGTGKTFEGSPTSNNSDTWGMDGVGAAGGGYTFSSTVTGTELGADGMDGNTNDWGERILYGSLGGDPNPGFFEFPCFQYESESILNEVGSHSWLKQGRGGNGGVGNVNGIGTVGNDGIVVIIQYFT